MSTNDVAWARLVRYISTEDSTLIQYGEPIVSEPDADILDLARNGKLDVKVCEGSDPLSARPSDRIQRVAKLLGPLEPKDVPYIRCIGLNYKTHSTY